MPFFQVRSTERDAQTDRKRAELVMQAIDSALTSSQREREALASRVREARDLASVSVGTGDDEYLTRDVQHDRLIGDYEREMMRGERRLLELEQHIQYLVKLRDLAARLFTSEPEATN